MTLQTAELLREVAEVYSAAYRNGIPPTKAVVEHFGFARSTGERWVSRARQLGYLGPAHKFGPEAGAVGLKRDELQLPSSAKTMAKWLSRHPNTTIVPRRHDQGSITLIARNL